MSKNFIKEESLVISNRKSVYIKFSIILILILIISSIFIFYSNKYIIDNSKDVHSSNIELNNYINILKKEIEGKNIYIEKIEKNNKEISSIFNKYTDAVKFKVATAEEIKRGLFKKDNEILELNRQINYYKYLINAKDRNNLISIENFDIEILNENNIINYSFLLLSNKNNTKVKGIFNFYYDGKIKNKSNSIKRKKLKATNTNISFTNFLKLSGKIDVPPNLEIDVLYLDVKCNGKLYNYKHIVK